MMLDIERLLDAIRMQESGGNQNAVSPAGARTAYGIMPATAADPGYGVKPADINALAKDEDASRSFARDYLTAMYNKTGDWNSALAAYNGGLGRGIAFKSGGKVPTETANYVPGVMKYYNSAATPSAPTPERARFDTVVAQNKGGMQPMSLGSAPDMVAEGMAAENMPAFAQNSNIGSDFLQGNLGMRPEQESGVTTTAPDEEPAQQPAAPAGAAAPAQQEAGAAEGGIFDNLLHGSGDTKGMGFFERLRQPGTREALMRFGAGLAGGASKGWGAGIGAGFEGAADALDQDRKLKLLEGEQSLKNLGPALAYKYNLSKGMKPNEALLRAVKPEMFGEWDVVQTGETPAGAKVFREHNKTTGEWRDPPANAQAANDQSEAEGPDLLKSIEDPNDRKIVEKLSTYDWNPADISIRGKHPRSWYMGMAQRVNPGLDVTNYPTRFAAKKEFMTGSGANSPANVITMGNTAIKHLGEMSDEAEKLDNFNTGIPGNSLLNYGRNEYKKASGTATDLSAFEAAREKYVDEATKFYRGTGGNESDILRGIDLLSSSKSLPELRSAVNENVKLMQSKIDALQDRWHQAVPGAGDFPIVHEDAQGALDRIGRRFQDLNGPADTGVTPPPPPEAPQTIPAGIDPEDWKYMSADQRKLFGAQ